MKIQLSSSETLDERTIIADFDAPTDDDGYVVGGPLAGTSGNLYVFINGVEYGSLFFHRFVEKDSVSLGAYSDETEWWEPKATIYEPIPEV